MKRRSSSNFSNVTLVSFCNRYRHFAFNSALSTVKKIKTQIRPAESNLQEGLKIYTKGEKNLIPSCVSISNSIVKINKYFQVEHIVDAYYASRNARSRDHGVPVCAISQAPFTYIRGFPRIIVTAMPETWRSKVRMWSNRRIFT